MDVNALGVELIRDLCFVRKWTGPPPENTLKSKKAEPTAYDWAKLKTKVENSISIMTLLGFYDVKSSSLQLEEREKERAAFATMQRPDFDGSGGTKIQGDMHETWIDKLKKGWAQEPLLPLVPVGMKSLVSVHPFHIGCVNGTKYKCVTGPGSSDNRTKI